MSRKDYIKFAEAIKLAKNEPVLMLPGQSPVDKVQESLRGLTVMFANIFATDNPNFDKERFYKACEKEQRP
jgi:hypothetical protein